jgi:hypothetical protein
VQPLILYGGSSKERKAWATESAKKSNWNLFEAEHRTFVEDLYKMSVTTNLTGTPNIIFFSGVENFKESEFNKLQELTEKTPHKFILSSKSLYKVPKQFREKCSILKIGEPAPDDFFEALNSLMLNPNREEVREVLEKESNEVTSMLFILQNNIWKVENPQAHYAVETCSNLIYKVSSDYQVSMLAYLFPVCKVPLSYEKKQKLYKEEGGILCKLQKGLHLSKLEAVESLNLVKFLLQKTPEVGLQLVAEFNLSEKEKEYLGITENVSHNQSQQQSSLQSNSGLEQWF